MPKGTAEDTYTCWQQEKSPISVYTNIHSCPSCPQGIPNVRVHYLKATQNAKISLQRHSETDTWKITEACRIKKTFEATWTMNPVQPSPDYQSNSKKPPLITKQFYLLCFFNTWTSLLYLSVQILDSCCCAWYLPLTSLGAREKQGGRQRYSL